MTVDIALHVGGALGLQALGALIGGLIGSAVGAPWLGAAVGAVPAGIASAWFWRWREYRQAKTKASGRVNHEEWIAPAIANGVAAVAFGIVAVVVG